MVGEPVEVIDSFFQNAPADAKPLWFLGKSLELLAGADIAYFAKGWQDARGCKIENTCAIEYGIPVIEDYTAEQKGGDPDISHRQGMTGKKGEDYVEVTVRKDEIKISGHANYAVSGSDIVCAGVTAHVQTLIKSIKDLTDDKIEYEISPGRVDIKYGNLSEKSKTLVDSFFIGICMIAEEFPEYVRIM